MAESKGDKRRTALFVVFFAFLGVVIITVFGYMGIVNRKQLEVSTTQTAKARVTEAAVDSRDEPPTATIPPTGIPTNQPTPTATETPTHTPTNPTPHGTLKFTPELFIYHTP